MKLIIIYPQAIDYEYLNLPRNKMNISQEVKPSNVTKFHNTSEGSLPYYQMFSMPFNSLKESQATLAITEMQEVAADAHRISSGGAPSIMIGEEYISSIFILKDLLVNSNFFKTRNKRG